MTPPPPLLRSGEFLHPPRLPSQGSWLGAAETERLLQICIEKPKPQIQFAVWKGRNEHRG